MSTNLETTIIATQYRLGEWAKQLKEYQNRLAEMTITEWYTCHSITKVNCYYRLHHIRKTYMEHLL